jgi:hypothetical protein
MSLAQSCRVRRVAVGSAGFPVRVLCLHIHCPGLGQQRTARTCSSVPASFCGPRLRRRARSSILAAGAGSTAFGVSMTRSSTPRCSAAVAGPASTWWQASGRQSSSPVQSSSVPCRVHTCRSRSRSSVGVALGHGRLRVSMQSALRQYSIHSPVSTQGSAGGRSLPAVCATPPRRRTCRRSQALSRSLLARREPALGTGDRAVQGLGASCAASWEYPCVRCPRPDCRYHLIQTMPPFPQGTAA